MTLIKPKDCPYYLISRVSLSMTSALKKGFTDADAAQVKPAYLGVLMSLWEEDGLKVIDLGRKAGLEPSTMTGLLDRMENDGLLMRSADPMDRRVQRINLTKEGLKIKDSVLEVVDKVLSEVFQGITEKDISHLKGVLGLVLNNTQEGKKDEAE